MWGRTQPALSAVEGSVHEGKAELPEHFPNPDEFTGERGYFMRAVVQRVSRAKVTVNQRITGEIG